MAKSKNRMPKYPPKPSKAGRPTDLTQEVQDKIVSSLLIGNYFETACASAGIHKTTAYDWLKWAAHKKSPKYVKFANAVDKAQADAESRDVMVIEMTAHGTKAQFNEQGKEVRAEVQRDWKAAAWRLERKHPKKWGRIDRHEVSGQDGKPIQVKTFVDLIKELEKDEA